MYQPHPNLTKEINDAIAESELNGGVNLQQLEIGKRLIIKTRNTTYTVEKTGDRLYTIYGNARFCPSPTPCYIHGSTFGGSMLKIDYVGIDMCLEFRLLEGKETVTTSRIQEVHIL